MAALLVSRQVWQAVVTVESAVVAAAAGEMGAVATTAVACSEAAREVAVVRAQGAVAWEAVERLPPKAVAAAVVH